MNAPFYKLGGGIVALDAAAAWLLASQGDLHLLLFWLLHGLASAAAGLLVWTLLPRDLRAPRRLSLTLLVLIALFFPVVGVFGLLFAARLAQWIPLRRRDTDLLRRAPQLQVFSVSHIDDALRRDLPAGQTARIARDQSQPQPQRIRAVLALREMTPRRALPVLRQLLSDPDEEIRLLAYGIVSTWEQRLTEALQAAMREFERARQAGTVEAPLARAAQRVAELQMEFAYQGLAQGDLRDFAIAQALHHCAIAREALPRDIGLQMMFLRLSLAAGRSEDARAVLRELIAEGASSTLWRPYAAELEWIERHFGRIHAVLQPLGSRHVAPRLRPVVRIWQHDAPGGLPAPEPLRDADRLLPN